MKYSALYIILFLFICDWSTAQKSYAPVRINDPIKIDGILDEAPWEMAQLGDDFIQIEPSYGDAATLQTEIQVLYDDQAMYISARLYDHEPDSIVMNLTQRDDVGINDWFFVYLDTYGNGLNAFGFGLTPAGVQADLQFVNEDESYQWDAVWDSAVSVNEEGWVVEMEIPYSAIRFSDADIQDWNINFVRRIRRKFERSFWNPVDPNIQGVINQSGQLTGLENIKSPIRLSLTPFVVGVQKLTPFGASRSFGAGMDLKYGLTDAFTLDMTIIPDFSQVRSDDQVFNLTPFEIRFDENRPFFTEGTDIFQKGGFFYSRRIGERPFYTDSLNNDGKYSEFKDVRSAPQLVNATKISGRTDKGTGIGFFNAIEARHDVTAIDLDGNEEKLIQHPLTNYNVSVIDQNFKNNSFVSFINTNVWRQGDAYDANLTGVEFQARDKDQRFQVAGKYGLSQKYYTNRIDLGHTYFLELAEIKGKNRTYAGINVESANYDPNDLGFLFSPNERSAYLYNEYNDFKPKNPKLQRWRIWKDIGISYLFDPFAYSSFRFSSGFFAVTKGFVGSGANLSINPINIHDYFEPRTSDFSKFYVIPGSVSWGGFVSTDYSKTLALNANINFQKYFRNDRFEFSTGIAPRWTISSSALAILTFGYAHFQNDEGFVNKQLIEDPALYFDENEVAIGRRNRNIFENELSLFYIFTNRMSSNLRIRHYWDVVAYDTFFRLGEQGAMVPVVDFMGMNEDGQAIFDANTHIFNVDLNYLWRFAPGSDIIFSYRSNAFAFNRDLEENYIQGLSRVLETSLNHTLSLKVLYFLDVARVSKRS